MQLRYILCSLLVLSILGCGKREEPPSSPVSAKPPMPLQEQLWMDNYRLWQQGDTNAVIELLTNALQDKRYATIKPLVFRQLIQTHLMVDNLEVAQKLYLDALDNNPEMAIQTMGAIESHLERRQLFDELIEWCNRLLQVEQISTPGAGRLYGFIMSGYRGQGKLDELFAVYGECAKKLPTDQAVGIIRGSLNATLAQKQYEQLNCALDYITTNFKGQPPYVQLVVIMRFNSLLQQGQLNDAADILDGAFDLLPDNEIATALNSFCNSAIQARALDMVERFAQKTLADKSPESRVFAVGAYYWVMAAMEKKDASLTRDRTLSLAREYNAPLPVMMRVLGQVFYFLMADENRDTRLAVLDLCEKLHAETDEDRYKAVLADYVLHACFLTEKFERALAVVQAGIPGMEPLWQEMLMTKIKAHIALAQGRTEEAIDAFRQFMDGVKNWHEPFTDPANGTVISSDSILGLNASRIADLWASAGEHEKAQAARKEAREYYSKALEQEKEGSARYNEIQASLAKLGD